MTQASEKEKPEWEVPQDGSTLDDPLLDCLRIITKHYGHPVSKESIKAGLPMDETGIEPSMLVRAAERLGYSARILKRKLKKIQNYTLPAILLLENKGACVLISVDHAHSTAEIIRPEAGAGEEKVDLKELEESYLGYCIFLRQEYHFDKRAPEHFKIRSRNWFWGTLFKSWRIYRDVLAASFLINLFALASPLFIMNVYDRVVPNNAIETLWVLAIGIAVVYGFDLIMRALRSYFIDIAGKKSEITLSSHIFSRVMGLKMVNRPASAGAFAANLREFDSVRDFITSSTITVLIDLPFIFLFLLVINFIGGPIILVPAIGIPIVLIYSLAIQPALRKSIENTFRMSAQRSATLIEGLIGLESIKATGAEGQMQKRWEDAVAHISNWAVKSRIISSSAVNLATTVQHFVSIGTVIVGVYLIAEGNLSMGGLIACVILAGRAMAPMGQIASLASKYNHAKSALGTLKGIMSLEQERPDHQQFVHRPTLQGAIEFRNVTFTYPEQTSPILNNVSFKIPTGQKVALIGRIGSGKTTIEKLILGLYQPDSGSILIDGIDIHQIDPADLRRNIGYAPQDTTLFFGSVKDNITIGVPHVEDKMILKAAYVSGVDVFVNSHPSGYDMEVGERGINISGGQRQSIAVARALLLDPPILLFDEPTNSMDNSTEELLKHRLEPEIKNKTMFVVTHRASLTALADRIIVLEGGHIIADGPKEQVMTALRERKLNIPHRVQG
jgi:ATP-binding cassette subfamily C protein LapB